MAALYPKTPIFKHLKNISGCLSNTVQSNRHSVYSPVVALNRTYALSKANGKAEAIIKAEKLNLSGNHLYHSLLGELYSSIDDTKAIEHFKLALRLAKSKGDREVIKRKIADIVER